MTDAQNVAVKIRGARETEGELLREIAIAAKAHWGYDLESVRQWAAGGDFSAVSLREKEIFVAEAEGRPIGWASLIGGADVVWLDDLWVEPAWIGRGVGSLLFGRAVERARALGGRRLEWEAEPNAVGFYAKLGGRHVRDSEPTVWGRVVPVMALDLATLRQRRG